MAARSSILSTLPSCSINLAKPCIARLWKYSDFSVVPMPRYSMWALASAYIAFMIGALL